MTGIAKSDSWLEGHVDDAYRRSVFTLRVTDDPLLALAALYEIEGRMPGLMKAAADEARASGSTWRELAEACRISRQAAQSRWR